MKYELKQYVEDKAFVEGMLKMIAEHVVKQRGANNYAPDTTKLLTLWKSGVIKLILMKSEDDTVVGYQAWLLSTQLHDMLSVQATLFSTFISDEHRGSEMLFNELTKYSISAMKILGAVQVLAGADTSQPWFREKLTKLGFTQELTTTLLYTGE